MIGDIIIFCKGDLRVLEKEGVRGSGVLYPVGCIQLYPADCFNLKKFAWRTGRSIIICLSNSKSILSHCASSMAIYANL